MKTYETLKEIIKQLELPDYQTKDELHKLTDNEAFTQLKALAQVNNLCLSNVSGSLQSVPIDVIEDLKSMSNNYQVISECYVIPKSVIDIFIEYLESQRQRFWYGNVILRIIKH